MNLSDSRTVRRIPLRFVASDDELLEAWSVIATTSAATAARRATAEQRRGLRVFAAELAQCHDPDAWASLASATHAAIVEASGNGPLDALGYELWVCLDQVRAGGQTLWHDRDAIERLLFDVVDHVVAGVAVRAGESMRRYCALLMRLLGGTAC